MCISACKESEKRKEKKYPNHIGDVEFNHEADSSGSQPCHADLTAQYYNFNFAGGLRFKGEKLAIDRYFKDHFKPTETENEDGYITIRFLVNCEGKACWLRTEEMDLNYQSKHFAKPALNQLLKLTKELEGWEIAGHEGESYDYYQYLTFKMINGQLIEILP